MRALLVHPGPDFSVHDVFRGWSKAFRNLGVEVVDYNLNDRLQFYEAAHIHKDGDWVKACNEEQLFALATKGLEATAFEWWPDFVVFVSAFFIPPFVYELLRRRNMKIVILHTEAPYEQDRQVKRAQYADINIVNDPTGIEAYPDNTYYAPHSYDPEIHYRRMPRYKLLSDFAFVGTGFASRVEFLEQVDWSGIDALFAGQWKGLAPESPLLPFLAHPIENCIDNTEAVDMYCSSKLSANLYRREAERPELSEGWACGPREIELAATRTFFLRDPRDEGDELFPMLPTFDGPGDFEEKLRWWLAHESQRDKAAYDAQLAVLDHTFENRAKELLARI